MSFIATKLTILLKYHKDINQESNPSSSAKYVRQNVQHAKPTYTSLIKVKVSSPH